MILLSSDIFKKSYVRGVISYISTEIVDGILVGGCLYKVYYNKRVYVVNVLKCIYSSGDKVLPKL